MGLQSVKKERVDPEFEGQIIALPGEGEPPGVEDPASALDGEVAVESGDRLVGPGERQPRPLERLRGAIAALNARLKPHAAPPPENIASAGLNSAVAAEEPPVDVVRPAIPPATPSVRKTRLFIGAVSTVALLGVIGVVALPGARTGQVQVAETGMSATDAPPPPRLIAPSADLASVPKREVVADPTIKLPAVGGKDDPLHELLALKQSDAAAPGKPAPAPSPAAQAAPPPANGPGERRTEGAENATPSSGPPLALQTIAPAAAPAPAKTPPGVGNGEQRMLETGAPAPAAPSQVKIASVQPQEVQADVRPAPAGGAVSPPPVSAVNPDNKALSMVTELSALVKSIRTDVAKLQTAQHADAAATAGKLDDFERRLLFAEAKSALNEAKAAGTESADDAGLSPIRPLSPSKAAVAPKAGRPPVVKTAALQTEAGAPKRYRVQAASPGLAMLGEVDRTGDDGSPLQVAIGTEIPGYGKVKSIDQRGTTWVVVTTEGGSIQ